MMNKLLKDVIQSMTERHDIMVNTLYRYCQQNSGSENLKGLTAMRENLANDFQGLADEIHAVHLPDITTFNMNGEQQTKPSADALLIRKRPECQRRVLLCGHMDTVYSEHSSFQQLTTLDANTLNGPGVSDMKGGLIVMREALLAFEATEHRHTLGWDVFINPDEEIGSPASMHQFESLAKPVQAALVYEPSMTASGLLAKNRRGSGKLTLIAKGKSAHVGRAFDEGHNAIVYLAKAIEHIHALNGQKEGVTLNVGKIAGGEALNMVPDKAVAKLDIRISHEEDAHWVMQSLQRIQQNMNHPYCSFEIHGQFSRPVKRVNHATQQLFQHIQQLGRQLGLALDWQDSGGCCDGNNFSALGLPVMDTLGVRGGAIHSENEYILLDSLVERAQLSTLILHFLATGGLEELKP